MDPFAKVAQKAGVKVGMNMHETLINIANRNLPTPPRQPWENGGATANPTTPQAKDPFDTIASLYGAAMGPQTSGQPQYVVVPPVSADAGGGAGVHLNPTFVGIAAVGVVGWFVYRWWKKRHQ